MIKGRSYRLIDTLFPIFINLFWFGFPELSEIDVVSKDCFTAVMGDMQVVYDEGAGLQCESDATSTAVITSSDITIDSCYAGNNPRMTFFFRFPKCEKDISKNIVTLDHHKTASSSDWVRLNIVWIEDDMYRLTPTVNSFRIQPILFRFLWHIIAFPLIQ